MDSRRNKPLPAWYERPEARRDSQSSLFPEDPQAALSKLHVPPEEAKRWHKAGWLSFDPSAQSGLEPEQIAEIAFIRDIARSGIPEAGLSTLFDALPKPVAAPGHVSFSFKYGWVCTPAPLSVVASHVDEWLDALAEDGEAEKLIDLRDSVLRILEDHGHPSTAGIRAKRMTEDRWAASLLKAEQEARSLEGRQSGDDSALQDVFEEWAYQLQQEESVFFEMYEEEIKRVCHSCISALPDLDRELLAVELMGLEKAATLGGAGIIRALRDELFSRLRQKAANLELA